MTLLRPCVLALMSFSASVSIAHADTFNFSFSSTNNISSGSGTLTGDPIAGAQADRITSITGYATSAPGGASTAIASILAAGTFPTPSNGGSFSSNDNTLFVSNGVGTLTQNGLSFILTNGAQINLYNGATTGAVFLFANGIGTSGAATIRVTSVTTTPEPTSLALLGTGLLGCVSLLKRPRR